MTIAQISKPNGKHTAHITEALSLALPPLRAAHPPIVRGTPKAAPQEAKITFNVVQATPADAEAWIQRNFERNRQIRRARVDRYKRLIADGEWRLTHQGIAFDHNGVLIDGQHRVTALAEMPVGTVVEIVVAIYQVDTRALGALDVGATKSASDVLSLDGLTGRDGAKRIAAITQGIFQGLRQASTTADHQQISHTYLLFQKEIDWAAENIVGSKCMIAPIGSAFAYAYGTAPERVAAIAARVISGVGLVAGSAELALHTFVTNGLRSKSHGGLIRGTNAHRTEVFSKTLTAIKYALDGVPISKLQAPRSDGDGLPHSLTYFVNKRKAMGLPTGL